MGLETPFTNKYIDDLVPANPIGGTDPKSQGDDHIRGIKLVLQNSFSKISGAVLADEAELNLMDGCLATTDELNLMAGCTATTDELNILDGVTAIYTELNLLAGCTATTDELNILDGVTADKDEINLLAGRSLSSTDDVIDNFPTLTRMLFQQTDAPLGWTKVTSGVNEHALRVVSGAVVGGGDTNYTSVFTATKTTSYESSHTHSGATLVTSGPNSTSDRGGGANPTADQDHGHSIIGTTGSGSSHRHTSDLKVHYLDVIIAVKD
jgi:hypothetical protein